MSPKLEKRQQETEAVRLPGLLANRTGPLAPKVMTF